MKTLSLSKPKVIEKHLKEYTDFDSKINSSDKICYTRYRSHLTILNMSSISRDCDLDELVVKLCSKLPTSSIQSVEQATERAMKMTTIEVGKELLKGNAMLLPSIREQFYGYVTVCFSYYPKNILLFSTCSVHHTLHHSEYN